MLQSTNIVLEMMICPTPCSIHAIEYCSAVTSIDSRLLFVVQSLCKLTLGLSVICVKGRIGHSLSFCSYLLTYRLVNSVLSTSSLTFIYKMPGLTDEILTEIRDGNNTRKEFLVQIIIYELSSFLVFSLYDDRGDQHIPKHYLGEALRALGLNPTEAEIRHTLTDLNRIERLSMQQFQVIFERLNRQKDIPVPAEEFIDGLRVFDKDGNGLIPATELRHLLTTLGMI